MGDVVREDLPFPVAHYSHVFLAFAKDDSSTVALCACSKSAVENYVRLRQMKPQVLNSDPIRMALLDSYAFPRTVAESSTKCPTDPLSVVRFKKRLCHRCNLVTPTLRYCHEMYGTRFIQYYGWYVSQTTYRLGIDRDCLHYLPDVCPQGYQEDILALKAITEVYADFRESFHEKYQEGYRAGDRSYWNQQHDEMRRLDRICSQTRRRLTRKIENITRQEFGFRKVGEGWVSETILYQIVSRILADERILRHHRPDWLEGLELDIYIPSRQLAFEYQGQQHFHPVKVWGGQKALEDLKGRDMRKAKICKRLGVKLIIVDYTEPLTEEYIREVLEENGIVG